MTRGFIGLLMLVLAAGIAALGWATDGFRVVTSEGARRLAIERHPRPVPEVQLLDQDGSAFSLRDYRGRSVLVDFIYTRCPTVCLALGSDLQAALRRAGEDGTIAAVSISFDPENDDVQARKLYGERFGAKAPRWRIAAPVHRQDLDRLLQAFGVVVIPDGIGGFIHDGGLYMIDPHGLLVRVLDAEALPMERALGTRP